ncbi:hypothetical protein Hamer_G007387 [Homarus americanus]|uniref:Uncharacterized protein n=2 Tax=Homarus americanus TaxID=6706 RepID=A0A8J5JTE9_HOMAM|nr:hypothetical protein Hamer_G007387 [Homarus americanus]
MEEEESEVGMIEYEYLGKHWASFVTCRIHLSKLTTVPEDDITKNDMISDNLLSNSSNSVTVGNNANKCEGSVTPDDYRQMFSAEVIKNEKKTKLVFTIHEDGLRWRPQS